MSLLRLAQRISSRFRRKRFAMFVSLLDIRGHEQILDVGGTRAFWLGTGYESNVTLLNIAPTKDGVAPLTWVEGDACDLSRYDDHEWDVVVSNSVIEHVGDYARQQLMADEVRRVAVRYWVQAPYMHFPIEPHILFPFFQYLPPGAKRVVARLWPFSFPKKHGSDPVHVANNTRLLTKAEWRDLWPDAQLVNERFIGLTKSLIAFRD
ncbi:hypothetical protein BMS3Bbin02_00977 [bacterium BMS3Bbin02]|nr:hypothetical protein BMS3Bbin02_00977 [bacterium BMS3Bbin02]